MDTPFILHQQQHRVVTLTLHRPEARNALSTPCPEQLVARPSRPTPTAAWAPW